MCDEWLIGPQGASGLQGLSWTEESKEENEHEQELQDEKEQKPQDTKNLTQPCNDCGSMFANQKDLRKHRSRCKHALVCLHTFFARSLIDEYDFVLREILRESWRGGKTRCQLFLNNLLLNLPSDTALQRPVHACIFKTIFGQRDDVWQLCEILSQIKWSYITTLVSKHPSLLALEPAVLGQVTLHCILAFPEIRDEVEKNVVEIATHNGSLKTILVNDGSSVLTVTMNNTRVTVEKEDFRRPGFFLPRFFFSKKKQQ